MQKNQEENNLTEEELQTGLKNVLRDGLTTRAMITLTEGVFLVGFALKLNAPLFVIGLLASLPPLAQLVQIPSIYLIERYRNRRRLTIYASVAGRLTLLLIALIPFFFSTPELGLTILLIAIFLRGAFGAIGSSSWNSWMRDLIPQKKLGSFFSRRWSLSTALSIPLSLAGGYFISWWAGGFPELELHGYSILFSLGFIVGIIGVYFLSNTPEPPMPIPTKKINLPKLVKKPFRDENFKRLLMFLASWNFAIFLAAPFFTVYMIQRLGFSMAWVLAFTVISQVTNVFFFEIWGRFSDRYSNKSVLGVSGPLFLGSILLWTFTSMPGRYSLTIPLLVGIHVLMGISLAGVNLAGGNIGLKLAPRGQATSYLAASSLVTSLAIGIGPLIGGAISNVFVERELSVTLNWSSPSGVIGIETLSFSGMDFAFFFAFLIGLYSLYRLALVVEEGEVGKKMVLNELVSEIKKPLTNFSTAGGPLALVNFPIAVVKKMRRKRKKKAEEKNNKSK